MSSSTLAIHTSLEVLIWRDEQMAAISEQLEDAFPALLAELDHLADEGSLMSVAIATVGVYTAAGAAIKAWSEEQSRIAVARAETELEHTLTSLSADFAAGSSAWDSAATAIPAVAGVGILAGSLAAIPTVISFATITTSSFAFFATSTVSWPLFAVGAAALAIASYTGSSALSHAASQARASFKRRLHDAAARAVFGTGLALDARCLHNDLQALVVTAGRNRLQEAT